MVLIAYMCVYLTLIIIIFNGGVGGGGCLFPFFLASIS